MKIIKILFLGLFLSLSLNAKVVTTTSTKSSTGSEESNKKQHTKIGLGMNGLYMMFRTASICKKINSQTLA
ncbi:hypothetical protein [Campylobacter jejuni]|uniref:hypothetical protein n=1 Tax=Campylobacter jejuni TaxID=197 RepID=UPI002F265CC2